MLFLLAQGHSIADIRNLLQRRSGIAGIAGAASNVEAITQAANRGDRASQQAPAVSTADVAITIAGDTSVLNGLDTLVFPGGIGEHAAVVRSAFTDRPAHLGMHIDPSAATPGNISAAGATVRTLVVAADEQIVMDRQAANYSVEQRAQFVGLPSCSVPGSAGLEADPPGWP